MKLYKDAFKDLEFIVGVLQSKGYTYGISVIEEWNKAETKNYFVFNIAFYEGTSQYKGSIPVSIFKTADKANFYSKKVLKKLDKKFLDK